VKFWQEVDGLLLRQAAKYADAIRAAFIRSINVADIVERWTQAYPAGGLVSAAEARQWARQNIPVQRKPLADIIEHIYATGWVMGQDVSTAAYAHAQLGIKKAAPTAKDLKYALNINWDNWKPGNRPASLLVRPSGKFSQLLEQGRVSIKGMNDTTLDRVGTLLADTLESGAGYSELARNLLKDQITSRVVTDASRAGTIAVTEMSRALNTATVDNYKQFGVEKVEWLAIDTGVCDICPANEAQGPIPIGQMFESGDTEPPAHPNCRCTVVPVVDEGPEMTDEQFAQAIMDGEAPQLEPVAGVTEAAISNAKAFIPVPAEDYVQFKVANTTIVNTSVTTEMFTETVRRFAEKNTFYSNGDHFIVVDRNTAKVHGIKNEWIKQLDTAFNDTWERLPSWRKFTPEGKVRPMFIGINAESAKGTQFAFTYLGSDTLYPNPKYQNRGESTASFMGAAKTVDPWTYTFAHEMGHMTDSPANFDVRGKFNGAMRRKYPELFSPYGKSSPKEAYAEIFAEWVYGDRANPLVAAYAKQYGWDLTYEEYLALATSERKIPWTK
jgi:SPP1 gp7 family putative phage head morphogenesis protein